MEYMTQYSALALRPLHVLGQHDDLKHAALGLVSEVGEIADLLKSKLTGCKSFSRIQILGEVGDAFWFANLACVRSGLRFNELDLTDLDMSAFAGTSRAALGAADFMSLVNLSYSPRDDRPLPTLSTLLALNNISNGLTAVLKAHDYTVEQALRANLAKLSVRYSDHPSEDHALIRDEEAERQALEAAR